MPRKPLLFACALAAACGAPQYADDPDLAATRAAFRCDAPASPSSRRACEGLARFEAGGPVKGYPSEGIKTYLGRWDCSNDPDRIVFLLVGQGPGTPPVEVDDDHRAEGVVFAKMQVVAWSDVRRQAASATLERLLEGAASPNFTAPQREDGIIPPEWDDWRKVLAEPAPTPKRTVRSDGKSLLEAPGLIPAFWDDAEPTSAFAYIREIDDELVYVQGADDKGVVCVAHVRRLPGD